MKLVKCIVLRTHLISVSLLTYLSAIAGLLLLGDSYFRVLDVDDWYGVTALQSLTGEQEIIAQNEGDFLQCYTLLAKSEFEYFVEVLEEAPKVNTKRNTCL